MKPSRSPLALLVLFASLAGCGDKTAPKETADAAPPGPKTAKVTFAIDKDLATTIDMKAPQEHVKAKTSVGKGSIEVDLFDLRTTKGTVQVDLQSITTQTFPEAAKNDKQTAQARLWLEAAAELPAATTDKHRYATFTIASVDPGANGDVTKIAATSGEGDDLRKVSLVAKGSFSLHGHAVDKALKLDAVFHYPKGSKADSTPNRLDVKTTEPVSVVLGEHEVAPRDASGATDKAQYNLLGTKVADAALVTIELRAAPSK